MCSKLSASDPRRQTWCRAAAVRERKAAVQVARQAFDPLAAAASGLDPRPGTGRERDHRNDTSPAGSSHAAALQATCRPRRARIPAGAGGIRQAASDPRKMLQGSRCKAGKPRRQEEPCFWSLWQTLRSLTPRSRAVRASRVRLFEGVADHFALQAIECLVERRPAGSSLAGELGTRRSRSRAPTVSVRQRIHRALDDVSLTHRSGSRATREVVLGRAVRVHAFWASSSANSDVRS